MCGIAGILGGEQKDPQTIYRMLRALKHRGPDAEGVWSDNNIQLGHRRLSILDTSDQANQPMVHSSGRFIISFNGEIYNFQDIKKILEQKKYIFETQSDTEVLLHAWAEWGVASLQYLQGMFAFALWDKQKRSLFLVRDRFGEKPLYYFFTEDGVVFSSEIKSLTQHNSCPRSLNPIALGQFFSFNYILSDQCIYQNVHKLPPAHYLQIDQDKTFLSQYWDIKTYFHLPKHKSTEKELIHEWNDRFQHVVKITSISDVPLGAFLSGGIDSSAVVSAMCRNITSENVHTFSIGFHENGFNELPKSEIVARHLGVSHHTQILDSGSLSDLKKIVFYADEPFADTSMIPTYFLSQFARQYVTVCLSGDAGDEIFAGYETYKADKYYQMMRHFPFVKSLQSIVHSLIPDSFGKVGWDYKMKKFLKGMSSVSHAHAHTFWRTIFDHDDLSYIRNSDQWGQSLHAHALEFYNEVHSCHTLDQHLYCDMKTWLVDDILVKVDRMSMAHSLETRAPFLNHKLVEWAVQLPTHLKMRFLKTKYLLKKSQEAYLPKSIIYGKKEGFTSPVGHWLNTECRDLTLDSTVTQWVDKAYLEKLWKEHLERKVDNSYKLFGMLCLALWFQNYRS